MKSQLTLRIQVLRFVAEQGIVIISDVMNYFRRWKSEHAVRVMMNEIGITHQKYGAFKYGVWFVDNKRLFEKLRLYYNDIPRFKVRGTKLLMKVNHSLGVNHIRIALEISNKVRVVQWWSEEYLRALPPFRRDGISAHKIPDAIFWHLRKDGTKQKFFLEYERSLKAPKRYTAIFQFYDKRSDVLKNNVIYICETDFIKTKLQRIVADLIKGGKLSGRDIFNFVTLEDFNRIYAENQNE